MSEYPKPAFAVRLTDILKVKPFISTEETRYYLNGVCVDAAPDGGAICAATDGHRLGASLARDGVSYVPGVIVSLPKEIAAPPKLMTSPWLVCILTGEGRGHISIVPATGADEEDTAEAAIERVEDCSLRIGGAVINGTFPDWRRVVPKAREQDRSVGFNPEYLRSFGKQHIHLTGATDRDPYLVRTADPDFFGVLMPVEGFEEGRVPAWLAGTPKRAA